MMQLDRRSWIGGLLGLPFIAPDVAQAAGQAPAAEIIDTTDLALACALPLAAAMRRAAEVFRALNGVRVHVHPIGARLLLAQLQREVQIDLVVTRLADMEQLAALKLLAEPPFLGPWRDRLVIAGRRGIALATALAGTVAVPDAGTAADLDGGAIMSQLGLRAGRRIGVVDTAEGAFLLNTGAVNAALLYLSEVKADMLLTELAPVPDAVAPDTRMAAAVTLGARRPNPGAFLQFLATAPGRRLLTEAGLEELA